MGVMIIFPLGTFAGIGIVCQVWKCYEKCHKKKYIPGPMCVSVCLALSCLVPSSSTRKLWAMWALQQTDIKGLLFCESNNF